MLESSFQNLVAVKRLPDPLVAQLRRFTTALIEQGYADVTVRLKLQLLTNFGQWLRRKNLAVTNLDERLVDAFLKRKRQVHRGNLRTLQQFLEHLGRHDVIPARDLPCDRSPFTDILSGYEAHLRRERGLVAHTIVDYQSCVRKFLVERFPDSGLSARFGRSQLSANTASGQALRVLLVFCAALPFAQANALLAPQTSQPVVRFD